MSEQQPCPPEWQAWEKGTGLCPYCEGMPFEEWYSMCDCFMSVQEWEALTGKMAGTPFVPSDSLGEKQSIGALIDQGSPGEQQHDERLLLGNDPEGRESEPDPATDE